MHAWEAIQKTLDHIERRIGEDISIGELADTASLSLFYYQRLFSQLVRRPVREYIRLRRLARAGEALRDRQNRILDIALEYGFDSHATFTRAFKETYGITPAQYRDKPVELLNFDKPDLALSHVLRGEGEPFISEGIVLEMNIKTLEAPIDFIGVERIIPFQSGNMLGERPGVNQAGAIWDEFHHTLKDIPHIPNARWMGVCYHGGAPDGHTTYFAGAETESGTGYPQYTHWRLPARDYAVCGFEAESEKALTGAALGKAMRYTRYWLRNNGWTADGFFPEIYYPAKKDHAYMELWIPFRKRNK